MAYSNPSPGTREYRATIRSTDKVNDVALTINCTFDAEQISHNDYAGIVQAFVDLVDASTAFNVVTATRSQVFNENISTTP